MATAGESGEPRGRPGGDVATRVIPQSRPANSGLSSQSVLWVLTNGAQGARAPSDFSQMMDD